MPLTRIAAVLLPILLAAGCASAPPSDEQGLPRAERLPLEDSPWTAHELQRCVAIDTEIPAFAAVFDSSAVAERLAARPEHGITLLSVAADSGKIHRMRVITSTLEEPDRAAALEVIEAGVRRGIESPRFVGRLRVETRPGAPPSFRTGLSQECEPELFNRVAFGSFLQQAATRTSARGTVIAWVKVDEQRAVSETKVSRSSGNHELDVIILSVARRMQFLPARLDRLPVAVWVEVPVVLR